MRKYHCSDVTPVHHYSTGFSHAALLSYHSFAYSSYSRYFRNNFCYFRSSDFICYFQSINKNTVQFCFLFKSNSHFSSKFTY